MAVYYYVKPNGRMPVKEFLDSLPHNDSIRAFEDIATLNERGIYNCGLSLRHIEGKLWEIRLKLSAGYRIFYCMVSENVFLLHAYKKQGQKAPVNEIEIARKRMKEVLS